MFQILRKSSALIGIFLISIFMVGCGSNEVSTPQVNTTEQFKLEKVIFNLEQFHNPKIKYNTKEELETMFNDKFKKLLNDNKLLSNDDKMDKLIVQVNYERRFIGDATSFPIDSLGAATGGYIVKVISKGKEIRNIEIKNQIFQGGFAMNLKIIAGTLRDKTAENDFIEGFANSITNTVKNLN